MDKATTVPEAKLLAHAERLRGKVAVITGAANGIGRETALLFGKHGAKIVIGDLSLSGAESVVQEIEHAGGEALARRCDVRVWADQVALFDAAVKRFGGVDIVIPNAGIAECKEPLGALVHSSDGTVLPPNLITLEVNLTGVLYSTHLGLHYLRQRPKNDAPRAIILIGSMASWQAVNGAPVYGATKHGMLGLMRSLDAGERSNGIRAAIVHPGFANSALVDGPLRQFLEGIPLISLDRIAACILHAVTSPSASADGAVWLIPDTAPGVLRLPREQLKEGIYQLINERFRERYKQMMNGAKSNGAKL